MRWGWEIAWGRFTRTGALFTQSQLVAPPEAGGDSPPVLADKPDHVAFGGESRSIHGVKPAADTGVRKG